MNCRIITDPITIVVGSMPGPRLVNTLRAEGIQLNDSAVTLLSNAVFDRPEPEQVTVVERSVAALGLDTGGVLSQILAAAQEQGLRLCPPITGPYLRLRLRHQTTAPDSVMSNGRAPSGSLTIGSAPLRADDNYPKGFYLRVIDGKPWLRGYRCTDEHVWSPGDLFAFRISPAADRT